MELESEGSLPEVSFLDSLTPPSDPEIVTSPYEQSTISVVRIFNHEW